MWNFISCIYPWNWRGHEHNFFLIVIEMRPSYYYVNIILISLLLFLLLLLLSLLLFFHHYYYCVVVVFIIIIFMCSACRWWAWWTRGSSLGGCYSVSWPSSPTSSHLTILKVSKGSRHLWFVQRLFSFRSEKWCRRCILGLMIFSSTRLECEHWTWCTLIHVTDPVFQGERLHVQFVRLYVASKLLVDE